MQTIGIGVADNRTTVSGDRICLIQHHSSLVIFTFSFVNKHTKTTFLIKWKKILHG